MKRLFLILAPLLALLYVAPASAVVVQYIPAATQAEMEAGTVANRYVAPSTAKQSPMAAKAWGRVTVSSGVATQVVYSGVTSITRDSVGSFTVTWASAFSSSTAYIVVTGGDGGNPCGPTTYTTTTTVIQCRGSGGGLNDPSQLYVIAYGDLP